MTRSGAIAATTGTVYGLIDPRDKVIRYVGKTTQPLTQRLTGHYSGAAAQRVRTWVAELRAAGLKPLISPIRENVPVPDLDAAERWEITRILAAGGRLLNSTLTSQGRKLNEDRLDAEHTACWARLAGEARALLGGPFPPGDLTALVIPGETWRFMRQVLPGHRERVEALLEPGQPEETFSDRYQAWKDWQDATSLALGHLWAVATSAWSDVLRISPGTFATNMKAVFSEVVQTHWDNMEDASRLLALAVWYMVAVEPWRHLAEIGGLPLDSAPFIRWAGRDAGTREALTLLARYPGTLRRLQVLSDTRANPWDPGPGHLLGAVTAAYSGTAIPPPLHPAITSVLRKMAGEHARSPLQWQASSRAWTQVP